MSLLTCEGPMPKHPAGRLARRVDELDPKMP